MNKLTPLLSPLLLAACASQPKPTPVQIGEMLKTARVTVAPIERPVRLSERTKAQAVGGVVVASVLGTALGGGSVEASRVFAETTGQMLPASYRIDHGTGADLALAKKFSERFAAAPETPARQYVLSVSAQKWELGYLSFLTSQDYVLSYQFTVRLSENRDGKLINVAESTCGNLALSHKAPAMPLETWQADGYKALNLEAERVVEQCYQSGLMALGAG